MDATHSRMAGSEPARYLVVGTGWRAGLFTRLARAFPDRLCTTGLVARNSSRRAEAEGFFGLPAFTSLTDAVQTTKPDFVVAAVPWAVAPAVIESAVELGVPILCETPPAPDLEGLNELWSRVGTSGLVQVAEQYPFYPGHAARRRLVERGLIGEATSVQISSTHGYHAIALIRSMLGLRFENAQVSAFRTESGLAQPSTRSGWTGDLAMQPTATVIAHLDFGSGRSALYDFTDNQWHNPLRTNRILIRGGLGELVDDRLVRMRDEVTVVESPLTRRQSGIDMNLDGFDLEHIEFEGEAVYRNAWRGGRLADDEIAAASLLEGMKVWLRGEGPEPYTLAAGCQDHMLSLAIDESIETQRTVSTHSGPWA
ncbi:MAG TPA: Gfo/Idh/MocA family oxidoreductase, partial [Propionicimonas sp.]|nr:Gfo/Idh/MocA family oxidoreductase [Propionicimonas sp.]